MEYKDIETRLRELGRMSDMTPEQSLRLALHLEGVFAQQKTRIRKKVWRRWDVVASGIAACAMAGVGTWYVLAGGVHYADTPADTPRAYAVNSTVADPSHAHAVDSTLVRQSPFVPVSGVDMMDSDTGWAVSVDNALLRTTDGGKTWADVTPGKSSIQIGIDAVALSSNVCYVFATVRTSNSNVGGTGTVVYVTSDGGVHWKKIKDISHEEPMYMCFTDPSHGWLVTAVHKDDTREQGSIYRTVDGGRTWTRLANLMQHGYSLLGWVVFTDALHGISAGANIKPNANKNTDGPWGILDYNTTTFYTTKDGGKTWQNSHIPIPSLTISNNTTIDMTVPRFLGRFGYTRINNDLYTSYDAGETWKQTGTIGSDAIITFVDSLHGWEYDGYDILYTEDGGIHWNKTKGQVPGPIGDLEFINSKTGWATVEDGVYRTLDGGQSWTQVSTVRLRQ
jgi:photosystem II stability/assembly factor-like uncharacterized protein